MQLKMNAGDMIQTFIAVITAAGIMLAIVSNRTQLKTFNDQLKLNFFADYTKRYQEISLNLPDDITEPDFAFSKLDHDARHKALKYVRAYFDLCSEEYHLHQQSHIDDAVWAIWSSGIKHAMTIKGFQEAWQLVNRGTMYDPQFKAWIDGQIAPPPST